MDQFLNPAMISQLGVTGLLAVFAVVIWRNYTALLKSSKKDLAEFYETHKEDHGMVVDKLMDCVNKNTESNTKLSQAVHYLGENIKR